MFCPYYKSKEVFNGFNEMIEAFGGKPMTEEEFRSAELRNERTGRDFAAMEAAYIVYDRNGGNFLDMTPNGESSILFQTLLDHFGGDRNKAIIAKSNVYSDQFFNWFGDWTAEEKDNVSKVVDENGEPLVVYRGDSNGKTQFNPTKPSYNVQGIYIAGNKTFASNYIKPSFYNNFTEGVLYEVFINAKNPIYNSRDVEGWNNGKYDVNDSWIYGNFPYGNGELVVRNPNQIKHVENLGTWNPKTDNIYNIPVTRTVQNGQQFENASLSFFGTDIMSSLMEGESVMSSDLIEQLLFNDALSLENMSLAKILQKHNIPVILDASIGTFNLASTDTNNKTGESVIRINPNLVNQVTKGYLGEAILHEVVHAVTVNAINNPKTKIEQNFAQLNKKVFDIMSKAFPKYSALFNDINLGLYALNNEKEFAAVFITDNEARNAFYHIAKQLDVQKNGRFINTFKNFMNSILHLFVNKNVFNTNEAILKKYQTQFLKHLVGVPTQKAKKLSTEQLKTLYDSIDNRAVETEALIDKMKYLTSYTDAVERNNIRTITLSRRVEKKDDRTYSFDDIVNKLQIRVNALRTSDIKQSEKNKYINDTKTQIDMFRNQQTAKYVAITSTLRQVIPQVLHDVKELKDINLNLSESLTGTEYMYQMHSNIAMYNDIAETMEGLLNQTTSVEQIISEYNHGLPQDQQITLQDIEEVKRSVHDLASVTLEGISVLRILRDRTAKDILRKKAEKEGNVEDMDEYLNTITENPTFDDNISWLEMSMGAMDSASNNALRALSGIVNRALKRADDAVIDKTTKLLELQAALKTGESVVDLYEVDDKGFTTGYLIRKLNYGKFYKAYDNELKRINDVISKATGKIIEADSRVAPDDDTKLSSDKVAELGLSTNTEWSVRQAWNELRNKWLNDNCERKYNKRYYDAWNKVPQVAKDALDSINTEIASILSQPGVLGEDGYNHYENLSDEDWNTLQDLWIQKKLLRSDYDVFGNLKQEGSTEYKIAKSLQQLNKDLYGEEQQKIKKDKQSWLNALNKEIEQCGGKEAYNKWKNKEKNHGFNVKRFKKWHMRNSRLEFKKDSNGEAIVFKDIEDAMQGFSVDYGPEYQKLKDQAEALLKPYRAQNGEINASQLPDAVKNLLNEIYSQQYELRQEVFANNPALKELSKKYKNIFDQFIKFEDTEYYKQIKREIRKAATQKDGTIDYDVHDALLESYGHFLYDLDTGIEIGFQPHRWLQRMEAIDIDKYMEYQPGDAWTEKVDNENLLNKFDEKTGTGFDEKEGTAFVPKKSLYDNSKKFKKIEDSATLKALYDEVVNTMSEANDMQSNRLYADNFLLPQITGSLWKRMKRHTAWGKFKALVKYVAEALGIGYNPSDFSQIGSNMALDDFNSEGAIGINRTPISGKYPDGRPFHILPQYYTRRMEDPSQISSDLVNILSNYYKMSAYYKEKVQIKDDCETIVDFLHSRDDKRAKTQFKNNNSGDDENDESRTTKASRKFLEMNLYDMRRSHSSFKIGPIELQWSKTVSLWKTWTTRRNLGLNPKVALTGFLTTIGTHILESITGQHYGHEGVLAFGEAIRRLFQSFIGARYLGNPLSNDDMMVMAETFDIASQAERKWEGTHRNRLVQAAYKHSVFGFLSTIDFWSKSIIMVSILMNHHYVDGKFLSREDIRNSRYLYSSKKDFDKALSDWSKGPSLYKLLHSKNHRLTIDSKYKQAFDSAFDVIKDRIQKTTEYADGMATDLQRAAITQSVIGALVLIHKQYLPLIVQRYFGKRVYDYDTHQYKNGIFRELFNLTGQLMENNLLAGIGAGVFTGSAFGGVLGAGVGVASAIGMRAYGAYKHKHGKESKSVKDIFNQEFNQFTDKKSTAMSYANRYAIKNVAATVIGYRLIVQPLVGLVCSIADDDDDDTWWLQLLAYSLRAFEWEYYTAFRTDDMLNNMKSPTAATSVLDAAENLGFDISKNIVNTVSPQGNFLFDPSQTWDDWEDIFGGEENLIEQGAYEGWTPWARDFVKGTAFHNLWEQLKNSKAKRKYQENQIMRIHKDTEEE